MSESIEDTIEGLIIHRSAGCPRDVEDLLVFCRQHSIWNVVEEVKLEDVTRKFQEIGKGIGRFVIRF